MVIDEKALVSLMKRDYRAGAYRVAAPGPESLVIQGFGWVVRLEGDNVPREVLSLIVRHMGFLPAEQTAWRILKGKKEPIVQEEMLAIALETAQVAELKEQVRVRTVKKTGLSFEGWNVWQCTDNMKILLMEPGREGLLDSFDGVYAAGEGMYKEGLASRVYIWAERDENHPEQLKHLADMQWVSA